MKIYHDGGNIKGVYLLLLKLSNYTKTLWALNFPIVMDHTMTFWSMTTYVTVIQ